MNHYQPLRIRRAFFRNCLRNRRAFFQNSLRNQRAFLRNSLQIQAFCCCCCHRIVGRRVQLHCPDPLLNCHQLLAFQSCRVWQNCHQKQVFRCSGRSWIHQILAYCCRLQSQACCCQRCHCCRLRLACLHCYLQSSAY